MKRSKNKFISILKVHKKKIVTCFLAIVSCIGVSLSFVNWSNLKIIYTSGSSALLPLMRVLGDEYNGGGNIDLVAEAGGSGLGLQRITANMTNLGNISRSPKVSEAGLPFIDDGKPAKHGQFSQSWNKNELKTITLGWDGICLVYKPYNNESLDITQNNIFKIFEAFAGTSQISFKDLGVKTADSNTYLKPFARNGGSLKSGTADAFLHHSGLQFSEDQLNSKVFNSLETGEYGNYTELTKENNSEVWSQISSMGGAPGNIAYLSTGFVLNNLEQINKEGFKIATYNNKKLSYENIASGYDWYRPLNTIISLRNINDGVMHFIDWVMSKPNDDENKFDNHITELYKKVGIIPLNNKQYKSMCDSGNFWVSDYDLIIKNSSIRNTDDKYYGAIEQ